MVAFVSAFFGAGTSYCARRRLPQVCARGRTVRMCEVSEAEIDALMEKLNHVNKFRRDKAAFDIAELKDERAIPKLVSVLDATDAALRRSAVRTLACIGSPAVPQVYDALQGATSSTVRASCIDAFTQMMRSHPHFRNEIDESIVKKIHSFLMDGDSADQNEGDPVSRFMSSTFLGEVASASFDPTTDEDIPGNRLAFDLLVECIRNCKNPSTLTSIALTFGPIANRGDQAIKDEVLAILESAVTAESSEEGHAYAVEVMTAEINKIQKGTTEALI